MVRSLRALSFTLTVVSTLGCSSLLQSSQATAYPTGSIRLASAKYTYNPQLVRLYTYECAKKLQAVQGDYADNATQICQCSISQMQQRHPQMQAIQIVTKAQASIKNEPNAMPPELTPYFSPCISTRG